MVKYNSKGSLPQNADYYALLNRSDADWQDSVRQGLCIKGNDSDSFAVAPTPINAFPFTYACKVKITDSGTKKGLLDLANSGDVNENWSIYKNSSAIGMLIRKGGTNYIAAHARTSVFAAGQTYRLVVEFLNNTTINIYVNTVASVSVVTLTVSPLPDPSAVNRFGIMALVDSTPGYFGNDTMHWACQFNRALTTAEKTEILDNGNPYGVSWASATDSFYAFEGNMRDLVSTRDLANTNISLTERCDGSTYHCSERGFAVKDGKIFPMKLDGSGYAGLVGEPDKIYYPGPYPNTFTGNWHELTHAYFDKSDTDIWEDFIRNSINYDSENTNRWHVDELNPSYLEKYIKPDYRNKIFCGIDKGDYAGAIMLFESGIPEILKKDLRFWRKRKYFEVATRKIDIEPGIEYTLTGKSDSATVKIEAYNGENWIVMATGVTVTAGEYSEGITFSPYDFEGEVTYLMRVVSEVDDSVEELIDVTSDTVVRITATTTGASENVILDRIKLSEDSIIFWGDGDSTALTGNTIYNNLKHTYTVAGSYQVKIAKADKVKEFRLSNNKWSNFTSYDLRNADIDYFWLNATGSGFTVDTSHMTGWTVGSGWFLYLMPSGTYNIDTSHMTGWTVGSNWYLYLMPSGTYNIDTSHMTGWTIGGSWALFSMPAGTYNIDTSHMTGWTVGSGWFLYLMPSGTYNIDTSHMTGWTVGSGWYLRSMPAGTYNIGTATIQNWASVDRIDLYDLIDETTETNMMTEAEVIKVIEDIYAGRLTFTHTTPILNIAETNASLTDAGARTKVDHLRAGNDGVNTFKAWTINVNGYPA